VRIRPRLKEDSYSYKEPDMEEILEVYFIVTSRQIPPPSISKEKIIKKKYFGSTTS